MLLNTPIFVYAMPIVVGIIVLGIFIFAFALMFSPKLRAKMMGKQIKATKYMMDEHTEDVKSITHNVVSAAGSGIITGTRDVAANHAGDFKDLAEAASKLGGEPAASVQAQQVAASGTRFCVSCGGMVQGEYTYCPFCGKEIV